MPADSVAPLASPKPVVIAVLAIDGAEPYLLALPIQVFRELARLPDAAAVAVKVCAMTPGRIRLACVHPMYAEVGDGLDVLESADVVVIPTWHGVDVPIPDVLRLALRRAHTRGARVAGLCLGVFVLAQAGLLDGRRATTTIDFLDVLAQRYPRVEVCADVLYVDDDKVLTGAGRAAALDACLWLVNRHFGAETGERVARRMGSAPARAARETERTQRRTAPSRQDARLLQLTAWMRQHLGERHPMPKLAACAAMTERTFERRFRAVFGTSPARWLARERLIWARQLVVQSNARLDEIALTTGFGSAQALRKQFLANWGMSPSRFRRGGESECETP